MLIIDFPWPNLNQTLSVKVSGVYSSGILVVFNLYTFVLSVSTWSLYPYSPGLFHWHKWLFICKSSHPKGDGCNRLVTNHNKTWQSSYRVHVSWDVYYIRWSKSHRYCGMYRKISNIRRTSVGNKIVDHSDVVGASPVGTAPIISSLSTWHLASRDSTKKTARQYENLLSFGIWCVLY